jgi:hypothetical protein
MVPDNFLERLTAQEGSGEPVRASAFAVSTFDTDYLLVRAADLERAVDVLRRHGHVVLDE